MSRSGGATPSAQLAALADLASLLAAPSATGADARALLQRALSIAARLVPSVREWRLYGVAPANPMSVTLLVRQAGSGARDDVRGPAALASRAPTARRAGAATDHAHMASAATGAAAGAATGAAHRDRATLGLGAPYNRRVLRQRRPVILGRAGEGTGARPARGGRATRSAASGVAVAAYPLLGATRTASDSVIGAVVANARPGHAWSDNELLLLRAIAHHLGVLLARYSAGPPVVAGDGVAANAGADAGADERMEFIALAAHELRAPLATIKGYAQLLTRAARKGPKSSASALRSLAAIDQQTTRMADLISELLDMVRIQRGTLELYPHPLELEPLLRRVVEQRRELTDRHELLLEASAEPLRGQWDADRTEQIIRDLLDNAIRYSPHGGPVLVHLLRAGRMARICVNDRGIGIPPEERERIFEPYFRGELTHKRHLAGLGIGLYISRTIAERMGGRLWLATTSTEEEGGGSQFCLELPLTPS